ncbi:hypothetical protein L1077_22055 [Pseudoalteromonas luteoviolacea]|uniref:hypothetical protein n=1 Tax=Pseudoalteromonas luteoviolacea TaxID=43657 RepID=UPI001B39EA3C|nr:hypothetical protein [Pseudoalteromonas luteoviolacea]MBQ4880205.1 hypothetical protein [Pseudoalteromonas luteoviolacea]MBQ4909266.1 hypothetical protein [Pseudoalteromonas luteoviolacea]MCF6442114.1 hypothetical protein [Pseudoalteromonas luteoviolacea]
MRYFKTPEFLFEVFGEKQSILEVCCTIVFALLGSWIVYSVADISLDNWKSIIAFLLIGDVLAGCIANFSYGTNEFYSNRPKNRLIFIAIHVHIVVIAWLLSESMSSAIIVWCYTIVSAFIVNALKGKSIQSFVAANLMCYGIFLLICLSLPLWFLMVSMFFMIKVLFSFAVDHFGKQDIC